MRSERGNGTLAGGIEMDRSLGSRSKESVLSGCKSWRRSHDGSARASRGVRAPHDPAVDGLAEHSTLDALYARYSRSVFRRARTLLGDADAAEDATHEVFVRAMRGGVPASLGASPIGWLYRTTTNLCLNSLRDAKRRGQLLTAAGTEPRPGNDVYARVVVRNILDQVPEELQEIALYYYRDELSHDEIARIVGVSRRTVGNRLASFQALVERLTALDVA